jgi:hypothetical protein
MKITPKPGDYVRIDGMSKDQHDSIANAFMDAGFASGEYNGNHKHYSYLGISVHTKSLFYAAWVGEGNSTLNGRELSLSGLLGDEEGVWSGDGLPPVGVTVQYSADYSTPGTLAGEWYSGKVVAYHEGFVWLSDNGIRPTEKLKFRPLKSEREIAIEEIEDIHKQWMKGKSMEVSDFFGLIYDAGFKKSKDAEK